MEKFGFLFREKFNKEPKELTLEEIDHIAIKEKIKGYKSTSKVVVARGSIFKNRYYDIDYLIDSTLNNE